MSRLRQRQEACRACGTPLTLVLVARAPMPGPHFALRQCPRHPVGEPGALVASQLAADQPASNRRGVSAASPMVPHWALIVAAMAVLVFPSMGGLASPLRLEGRGRPKSLSQLSAGLRRAGAPFTAVQPSFRIGNRSIILGECCTGPRWPRRRRRRTGALLTAGGKPPAPPLRGSAARPLAQGQTVPACVSLRARALAGALCRQPCCGKRDWRRL